LINSLESELPIDDFGRYVLDNKIENVFRYKPTIEFLNERRVSLKFKESILFVCFHNQNLFWTDSWGYTDINDFLESYDNQIFFAIYESKEKYKDQVNWEDSVGQIYEEVKAHNYTSKEELEDSVKFFIGNLVDASVYRNIIQYVKEHRFRRIDELITSVSGGFANLEDYVEAKESRIPNIQTLQSYRLVEELTNYFDFKNWTEALLFAVLLKLKKEEDEETESERMMVDLDKIFYKLRNYLPKNNNTKFPKIAKKEDLEDIFLKRSAFSWIGFYSPANKSFEYSPMKLYIDGSNIVHNGRKRGEINKNLVRPVVSYLGDCISCLEKIGISPAGIYIDARTNWSINKGNEVEKKEYKEFKFRYNTKLTLYNEKADERLIQKLKDDPNCFVISNDSFDEYNLNDAEKGRLISFERTESGYVFRNSNGNLINDLIDSKNNDFEQYVKIMPLNNLDNWPYPEKYDSLAIDSFIQTFKPNTDAK
jgi:hypothetical protein